MECRILSSSSLKACFLIHFWKYICTNTDFFIHTGNILIRVSKHWVQFWGSSRYCKIHTILVWSGKNGLKLLFQYRPFLGIFCHSSPFVCFIKMADNFVYYFQGEISVRKIKFLFRMPMGFQISVLFCFENCKLFKKSVFKISHNVKILVGFLT